MKYSLIDTTRGQSGSPILIQAGDLGDLTAKVIVGIHTGGSKTGGFNYGTRVTKPIIKWITKVTGEYQEFFETGPYVFKE